MPFSEVTFASSNCKKMKKTKLYVASTLVLTQTISWAQDTIVISKKEIINKAADKNLQINVDWQFQLNHLGMSILPVLVSAESIHLHFFCVR